MTGPDRMFSTRMPAICRDWLSLAARDMLTTSAGLMRSWTIEKLITWKAIQTMKIVGPQETWKRLCTPTYPSMGGREASKKHYDEEAVNF